MLVHVLTYPLDYQFILSQFIRVFKGQKGFLRSTTRYLQVKLADIEHGLRPFHSQYGTCYRIRVKEIISRISNWV